MATKTKRSEFERSWSAHGLDCAVLRIDLGHRCGYCRVPEDHPWFGLDYDSKGHVAVHGGLTFAGKRPNDDCAEGWWFGFDCAHLGDTAERWTEDAVAAEVERMAEQIAAASTQPKNGAADGRE